jgi:nucleoside-diphosphate-sugar epimerase
MKTIAIIGSRSFLAKHFIDALSVEGGWSVARIDRPDSDIRDTAAIARALGEAAPDVVVNFAAISFAGSDDGRLLYEINAFGQENVLKALSAIGFSGRHVFLSSANVYGASIDPLKETDAPRPVNHYGCSKMLAEGFCNFPGASFTTHVVRPFNCIGVGQAQQFIAPKIVAAFRAREPELVLGNLAVERDFLDARDFAGMLKLLVQEGAPHQTMNFCTGRLVSLKRLIELAAEISGHSLEVRSAAGLTRASDISRQLGDNSRIAGLGYRCKFAIEDTIGWMLSA